MADNALVLAKKLQQLDVVPVDDKLEKKLDKYANDALSELWAIVDDDQHPLHKRYAFDALKILVQVCVPRRKEVGTGKEDSGGDLLLPSLFKNNTIEDVDGE